MKLSILQENLKQGIFAVAHVTGKNINLPILGNILIEAKDGKIRLVATDLEIGVESVIRGKVDEPGAFTVDAKLLGDYIGLLPNKKVQIMLKNKEFVLECDNYKTKIRGQSTEDYPLIPQVTDGSHYSADINTFRQALSQVVFAVSSAEARSELTGVFFDFKKDKLVMASTDSYRLAEKTVIVKPHDRESGSGENGRSVIVPAKTLVEIIRILSAVKDGESLEKVREMDFYITDDQILFVIDATRLVSRLIEGQYPDYTQIIPEKAKTRATVNKVEIVRAVKAAALFSKSGINDINLDFPKNGNQIVISSTSGQTGENITELMADVTGDDNGVVVNHRYLLDGLNNIDNEEVVIEVVNGNTPCIVRPKGKDDYLYIIMPIKQ